LPGPKVIEKTKSISFRSQALTDSLGKRGKARYPAKREYASSRE
jgi:hypothetical protein